MLPILLVAGVSFNANDHLNIENSDYYLYDKLYPLHSSQTPLK